MVEEGACLFEVRTSRVDEALLGALRGIEGVTSVEAEGELIRIKATTDVRPRIARAVIESGAELVELKGHTYTLEEIYLRYFQE